MLVHYNTSMGIIIKTPRQVVGIEQSCKLAGECLEYIRPFVRAGVTTSELDLQIEKFIYDHAALPAPKGYCGFPRATCISVNEVICHGIPGGQILKGGDIVNIDVTTILGGYYGDTSYMFAVGEVSDDAKKIMAVAHKCMNIGIANVWPGQRLGNIGFEINKYARSQGCSVVHQFCGHGVGIQFHEEPQVTYNNTVRGEGPRLRPGMIFTIEPMINLGVAEAVIDEVDQWTARTQDGALSAQYEHTVLVTDKGCRILTTHPKEISDGQAATVQRQDEAADRPGGP
jgi:methionyl aminopeptidase